jgi:hypothetical protein
MKDLIDHYGLTLDSTVNEVAFNASHHLLTDYNHLNGHLPPYRMAIVHEAMKDRPPVRCEWTTKHRCGIETRDRAAAQRWVVEALKAGATVLRIFGRHVESEHVSIDSVKKRIERRNAVAALRMCDDVDDEIPF